ncbi:small secreted protein [Streptomyces sp. NPDC055025]
MNKKLVAALSGGAVLLMTLSGCSDDSESKVNDWAKKVCDQVQPELKKIGAANTSIQQATSDSTKPIDVQRTDSAAFQSISGAYRALGSAVNSAGAPPVTDGEKTQQEAVKELNATSTAYAGLQQKVDELDTKDQADFADGLKGVADELDKLSRSGDKALQKLQSGAVGKAMAKQTGCQKTPPTSAGATGSSVNGG